jgi:hypothetical protein
VYLQGYQLQEAGLQSAEFEAGIHQLYNKQIVYWKRHVFIELVSHKSPTVAQVRKSLSLILFSFTLNTAKMRATYYRTNFQKPILCKI